MKLVIEFTPNTEDVYKNLQKLLQKEQQAPFHTFGMKSEKSDKVVITVDEIE